MVTSQLCTIVRCYSSQTRILRKQISELNKCVFSSALAYYGPTVIIEHPCTLKRETYRIDAYVNCKMGTE